MNNYQQIKENNINVFNDTMDKIHTNKLYANKGIKYDGMLNDYEITATTMNTNVFIFNENCIDECIRLKSEFPNKKVLLLNMASEFCPGGGVKKGSNAQEECICRCTNLYPSIRYLKYPLNPLECILSKNIKIIKDGKYNEIKLYVDIDVISMAALRRPQVTKGKLCKNDYDLMYDKVNMLLQTAYYNKNEILVLGAWGCGAFGNPPLIIANIFKKLLESTYKNAFEKIIFAIYETDPNQPLGSAFFSVFDNILN